MTESNITTMQHLQRPGLLYSSKTAQKNVLLLAAHDPIKDPRLGWMANGAPQGITILPVGTSLSNHCLLQTSQETLSFPQKKWKRGCFDAWLNPSLMKNPAGTQGIQELLFLESILSLSEREFCTLLNAPLYAQRNTAFRTYLRYILQSSAILLNQTTQITGLHAVIATDLPTLPTALILKGLLDIPILYDAHEYWPEADIDSDSYEQEFWMQMEARLVKPVDYCQTVSPGLAKLMSAQYHKKFAVVPNCVPLKEINTVHHKEPAAKVCRFLYQGLFAPKRGLDLLIIAWKKTPEAAILLLRGPDSHYKTHLIHLAKKTGLFATRILFLPPVHENQLIEALNEGDVGLIPYTPSGKNYTHCCPNKLSQYMAGQLPILANETLFIADILKKSSAGLAVDFANQDALVSAVENLTNDPNQRLARGKKAYDFACKTFHWEAVSQKFYAKLTQAIEQQTACKLLFFTPQNATRQQYSFRFQSLRHQTKFILRQICYTIWKNLIPATVKNSLLKFINIFRMN